MKARVPAPRGVDGTKSRTRDSESLASPSPVDFTIERRVGRLVEARVYSLNGIADVQRYAAALGAYGSSANPPILCADHRAVRVYAPLVSEALIAAFTRLNRVWLRALLVASTTNATLAIQLQRVVRASANDARRLVFDAAAGEAFLSDVLSAEERARLSTFLRETVPSP